MRRNRHWGLSATVSWEREWDRIWVPVPTQNALVRLAANVVSSSLETWESLSNDGASFILHVSKEASNVPENLTLVLTCVTRLNENINLDGDASSSDCTGSRSPESSVLQPR